MKIKMLCTKKYKISDERGWKLFLQAEDGDGYEAQGGFVIVVKDPAIFKLEPGESMGAIVDGG